MNRNLFQALHLEYSGSPTITVSADGSALLSSLALPNHDTFRGRRITLPIATNTSGFIPHLESTSTQIKNERFDGVPIESFNQQQLFHYYEIGFRGVRLHPNIYLDSVAQNGHGQQDFSFSTTKKMDTVRVYFNPLAYGYVPHIHNFLNYTRASTFSMNSLSNAFSGTAHSTDTAFTALYNFTNIATYYNDANYRPTFRTVWKGTEIDFTTGTAELPSPAIGSTYPASGATFYPGYTKPHTDGYNYTVSSTRANVAYYSHATQAFTAYADAASVGYFSSSNPTGFTSEVSHFGVSRSLPSSPDAEILWARPVALPPRFYRGIRTHAEFQITYKGNVELEWFLDGNSIGTYTFNSFDAASNTDKTKTEKAYFPSGTIGHVLQYIHTNPEAGGKVYMVETDVTLADLEQQGMRPQPEER